MKKSLWLVFWGGVIISKFCLAEELPKNQAKSSESLDNNPMTNGDKSPESTEPHRFEDKRFHKREIRLFDNDLGLGRHGGYGGPTINFTSFCNKGAVLVGGRGGYIYDHRFIIGMGGAGLVSEIKVPHDSQGRSLHLGYGGPRVEYTYLSEQKIHAHFSLLLGAGGGGLSKSGKKDEKTDKDYAVDGFSVIEPEAYAEINILPWFRIALGATYRLISGVNLPGVSNKDLSSLGFGVLFRFGYF